MIQHCAKCGKARSRNSREIGTGLCRDCYKLSPRIHNRTPGLPSEWSEAKFEERMAKAGAELADKIMTQHAGIIAFRRLKSSNTTRKAA